MLTDTRHRVNLDWRDYGIVIFLITFVVLVAVYYRKNPVPHAAFQMAGDTLQATIATPEHFRKFEGCEVTVRKIFAAQNKEVPPPPVFRISLDFVYSNDLRGGMLNVYNDTTPDQSFLKADKGFVTFRWNGRDIKEACTVR